ncbi:MAG: Rrf2 family transcriptional regulator [Bacteroidales bacterium]
MFNKETEYALRSLVYIKLQNMKNRRPGTAEIAKEIEAPPFFTAKILQRLVRAGFVESLKGKNGGFFFDKEKPDLKLEVLISSIEGNRSFSGCGFGLKNCSDTNPCPLHDKYAPIRTRIKSLVTRETVQSLARKVHGKEVKLNNVLK